MSHALEGKLKGLAYKQTTSLSRRWIISHDDWLAGRLPNEGGMMNQPARWVQAMRILDTEVARAEIRDRKKLEIEKKKRSRGLA